MTDAPMQLIYGSGNVYRDFGYPDADVRQLKAILAAQIIKTLDRQGWSARKVQVQKGVAAVDISRIRNANLSTFTVDRLIGIINILGARVKIAMRVKRHPGRKQIDAL